MVDTGDLACQEFVELVTEYLEGAMSPTKRAHFVAHLADCDYCVEYLDHMRLAIRTLGRIGEVQIAPDSRARLLAAFRDWKRSPSAAPTI